MKKFNKMKKIGQDIIHPFFGRCKYKNSYYKNNYGRIYSEYAGGAYPGYDELEYILYKLPELFFPRYRDGKTKIHNQTLFIAVNFRHESMI